MLQLKQQVLFVGRLGKKMDEVSEREREQTKRVVYSVMYGAGKTWRG